MTDTTRNTTRALEFGEKLALSVALCVLAQVHGARPADGLGHGGIDEGIHGGKADRVEHLCHLGRGAAVVPRRKPGEHAMMALHMHRCRSSHGCTQPRPTRSKDIAHTYTSLGWRAAVAMVRTPAVLDAT